MALAYWRTSQTDFRWPLHHRVPAPPACGSPCLPPCPAFPTRSYSLATGNWGVVGAGEIRPGVSQVRRLSRMQQAASALSAACAKALQSSCCQVKSNYKTTHDDIDG